MTRRFCTSVSTRSTTASQSRLLRRYGWTPPGGDPERVVHTSPGRSPGWNGFVVSALKGRDIESVHFATHPCRRQYRAWSYVTPFQGRSTVLGYPGRCPGLICHAPMGLEARVGPRAQGHPDPIPAPAASPGALLPADLARGSDLDRVSTRRRTVPSRRGPDRRDPSADPAIYRDRAGPGVYRRC